MEPFRALDSVAAPFAEANVDTDIIFPARFLLLLDKEGLSRHLLHERRHGLPVGSEAFILDRPPYDHARILVAGPNFGTGSSREQAVWALADFGIRCVIAPSFGEIFFANCFKSGVLPVVLPTQEHTRLLAEAEAARPVRVDLPAEVIRLNDGTVIPFEVEPHRKRALLEGLDEIGLVLNDDLDEIEAFEARHQAARPWLTLTRAQLAHFDDIVEPMADE